MKNNKIPPELEKYSPWPKVFRILEGPVLIMSIIYILVYLGVTFYLWNDVFKLSSLLQGLYFIGFGLFLMAILIAFIAFMLRSVNKEKINLEVK